MGDQSLSIKAIAADLGFMSCGIALAEELTDDARRLEQWLKNGYQAGMSYMERNFDLRIQPKKLVDGAQSIITLLFNYYPDQTQQQHDAKIARYAFGKDYHDVIRQRLNEFFYRLQEQFGAVQGRGFVDSAPVLERAWAVRSGLGWVGKNGNLLQKSTGSYFFIATLITDLKLTPDPVLTTDHCGNCTRCMDACPTQAIVRPAEVDANRCISYLTIELKDSNPPDEFAERHDHWLFGCDICQEVCPWNRFSKPHEEPQFIPHPEILEYSWEDWSKMSEAQFRKSFKGSPILRAKWKGIQRNLEAIKPVD